jgi:macrolide transport system ATP-binding/permease protein
MIELKNITKVYRTHTLEVQALRDVSLTIEPGEFIAIMGPSGSGKSTLLHILGFLDRPDSGEYAIYDRQISKLSDNELANLRNQLAGFVFQQFHLLQRMNALANVHLPSIYGGRINNLQEEAGHKLNQVGLADRTMHRPNELSGGQQQRVAIARALINDPLIIFADEPTGNLDTKSGQEIMEILRKLNAEGKTIIMVTHEAEIARYANRVIKMRDGRIISDEKTKETVTPAGGGQNIREILSLHRTFLNKEELLGHLRQAMNTVVTNRVRSFLTMLGILVLSLIHI